MGQKKQLDREEVNRWRSHAPAPPPPISFRGPHFQDGRFPPTLGFCFYFEADSTRVAITVDFSLNWIIFRLRTSQCGYGTMFFLVRFVWTVSFLTSWLSPRMIAQND